LYGIDNTSWHLPGLPVPGFYCKVCNSGLELRKTAKEIVDHIDYKGGIYK